MPPSKIKHRTRLLFSVAQCIWFYVLDHCLNWVLSIWGNTWEMLYPESLLRAETRHPQQLGWAMNSAVDTTLVGMCAAAWWMWQLKPVLTCRSSDLLPGAQDRGVCAHPALLFRASRTPHFFLRHQDTDYSNFISSASILYFLQQ